MNEKDAASANLLPDTNTSSAVFRRTKRQWSDEQKLEMISEAEEVGSTFSAVAEKYSISTAQLFTWRKQLRGNGQGKTSPVNSRQSNAANESSLHNAAWQLRQTLKVMETIDRLVEQVGQQLLAEMARDGKVSRETYLAAGAVGSLANAASKSAAAREESSSWLPG